jgi:long-chain acyl-CoA synthetase
MPHTDAVGERAGTTNVTETARPPVLSRLIAAHAEQSGDHTALTYAGTRLSYRELDDAATALASEMVAGHLAGERVAFMMPNGPEIVIAYLACFAAGAIATPHNSRYAPPEVERALLRARPAWLIVHPSRLAALAELDQAALAGIRILVAGDAAAEPDAPAAAAAPEAAPGVATARDAEAAADPAAYEPLAPLLAQRPAARPEPQPADQPAAMFFTSGSTGTPKGVLHNHASALSMLTSTSEALGDVRADDIAQVCEPLVHVSGFIGTLTTLLAGGTVALYDGFELEQYAAGLIEHRPTLVCTHIDIIGQLVHSPNANADWFSSLRGVYTGGDTVPNALQKEFQALTGKPIAVGWGMTEAIWLTVIRQAHLERDGCIGRPVGGAEVRADATTGELLIRGPMLMAGYWEDEKLTGELIADGWLHTGDLGSQDADGLWWFSGRLKDLIVRRTSKITPGEVEEAIDEHPDVAECAVVAAPDAEEGQVPVAFVVPRAGHAPTAAALLEFLGGRIAAYKLPARIHFLDALPLTPSGKIARRELREPSARV